VACSSVLPYAFLPTPFGKPRQQPLVSLLPVQPFSVSFHLCFTLLPQSYNGVVPKDDKG